MMRKMKKVAPCKVLRDVKERPLEDDSQEWSDHANTHFESEEEEGTHDDQKEIALSPENCSICCNTMGLLVSSFDWLLHSQSVSVLHYHLYESKEELSEDPMGTSKENATAIYPEMGQSHHGRAMKYMKCQTQMNWVHVTTSYGEMESFSMSPSESHETTQTARLLVVKEWEQLIAF